MYLSFECLNNVSCPFTALLNTTSYCELNHHATFEIVISVYTSVEELYYCFTHATFVVIKKIL